MIFLAVGTIMPFDRLVRAVDEAIDARLINTPVFAQIGQTKLKPKNMEYASVLTKDEFDRKVTEAEFLISHAGIGSITMAGERGKRLIVMPRLKRYGEHVNDHQVATARQFGALGHILVANGADELFRKLREVGSFAPVPRMCQPDRVAHRISQLLQSIDD